MLYLFPLHLASSPAYASSILLPEHLVRLDSRPVANGDLSRLLTYKTTRPCQAATNGGPHF